MTKNQSKYEKLSQPIFWTSNERWAQNSIFQWRFDEDRQMYYTTKLGIYNGFIGLFGIVMYYIPERMFFKQLENCGIEPRAICSRLNLLQ